MGRRITERLPSPVLIVAVLALVAALTGTALAGPDASTSAISKKKVKKIAKKQIKKLASDLSVAHADTAGAVDGFDANGLVRAAFATTANALPSGSNGTMLTRTIEAPGRGLLTIVASAEVIYPPASDQFECSLQMDDRDIANSVRVLQANGAVGAEDNCATNATRPVTAGRHKIDLEATNVSAADFGAAELSVIFAPFNGSGDAR
jgi:hypothetical protein